MERYVPSVFISYSWDSREHNDWVRSVAERLRGDGVNVTLDQWHVRPGTRLPHFMEIGIRDNDFVLVVCTEGYRTKSDLRAGGVGKEVELITGELLELGNREKFIPLLRAGTWPETRPIWLTGAYYLDFRGPDYEENYHQLVGALFGLLPQAPPLGSRLPGWALGLQYANQEDGVLLRVYNQFDQPVSCRVVLQRMDKGQGRPPRLQCMSFVPVPLSGAEVIERDACGSWIPLVFSTKADRTEAKIESKDRRIPSLFIHDAGIWRLRIMVVTEKMGAEVYSCWLSWNPGKVPLACDDWVSIIPVQEPK